MANTQLRQTEETTHKQRDAHVMSYVSDMAASSTEIGSDLLPQHTSMSLNAGRFPGHSNLGPRSQAMQQMQRTYGNRAVQRYVRHAPESTPGRVAVQRSTPEEAYAGMEQILGKDNPALATHRRMLGMEGLDSGGSDSSTAKTARKVRTGVSAAARTGRALTEDAAKATAKAAKQEADASNAYAKSASTGNPDDMIAAGNETEKARMARKMTENSKSKVGNFLHAGPSSESKVGQAVETLTGSKNFIGQGLGIGNYGLQLWQNLAEGQGMGESMLGAFYGGWANGQLTRHLFSGEPMVGSYGKGVGWADTAINVVNAGLNLVGAPEEATTVTQTVADATPSSFGTSVASNFGRGLWNLGDGIINGDWSGMKQQGHDLTHGKAGAPLQGYAVTGEAIYAGLSGDSEMLDNIREENRSGKRGKLAQLGSYIGATARDHPMAAVDDPNVKLKMLGLGLDDGPSEAEQQKNQAAFVAKRDKEIAEIEKNKDQIMREKGPQAYYHLRTVATLPPQARSLVEAGSAQ